MADRGTSVGKAYVQIMPSTEGIGSNISKALNGEVGGIGKTFGGKLAGFIKGAIATAGIGVAIKKSLDAGAALQQSIGGIETLYKDSADKVIENANRAFRTAGLSANDYMENVTRFSASLLDSLGNDTAKAADVSDMALQDMSDNANKFGTDMESIQNAYQGFAKQNYTMLDNLSLGFAGSKEGMQQLLDKAGELTGKKYDISNLADVYEAIHAVQEELDITGTTSKEAASTFAGSLASLKASADNFFATLALGDQSSMTLNQSMVDLFKSAFTFLVRNLAPMVANVVKSMIEALAIGAQAIGDSFGTETMNNLLNSIIEKTPQIMLQIAALVGKLAAALIRNAPKIIGAGLALVGAIATGLQKGVGLLGKKALELGRTLVDKFKASIPAFKATIANFFSPITSKVQAVKDTVKRAVDSIRNFFTNPVKLNIKMPHITWDTKEVAGIKIPYNFNISFYKAGGIMTDPTMFGMVGGEAGAEAILPLKPFWDRMDASLSAMQESRGSGGTLYLNINLDGKTIGQSAVEYINGQTLMFGASPVML